MSTFIYLISAIFFILSLNGLNSPKSAKTGLNFGIIGMIIAIINTIIAYKLFNILPIFIAAIIGASIGIGIAIRISMKKLPELMAFFHSLVGLAAVLVATGSLYYPEIYNTISHNDLSLQGILNTLMGKSAMPALSIKNLVEIIIGATIGAITVSGSIVAFLKLSGKLPSNLKRYPMQNILNLMIAIGIIVISIAFIILQNNLLFWIVLILALILGVLIVLPIGGADMPVVVSLLNSYSGWATAGIGFSLENPLLIIVGALVGSSGAILSYIMCKGMNRSLLNVIFGSFSTTSSDANAVEVEQKPYKAGSGEDAAFLLKNANRVIIVPGYGMAVAQAQHVLKELTELLKKEDVSVKYAIHPVAGRMPGHMNVLLAEANISYEDVFELEEINNDFNTTDVVFVIGANDVTNPSAKTDINSPLYGMPILDVINASTVLFVKRTMGAGYSGVDNPLFYMDKTLMLLGDAKAVTESIIKSI